MGLLSTIRQDLDLLIISLSQTHNHAQSAQRCATRLSRVCMLAVGEGWCVKGESKKLEKFAEDKDGDRWEVEAILAHRGDKASGRKKSTREYFVQWKNYNMEDYTRTRPRPVSGPLVYMRILIHY